MAASSKEFFVVIEQGQDGLLIAEVPQLQGCYTQARTLKELLERTREAIALCLEDEDVALAASVGAKRILDIQKIVL